LVELLLLALVGWPGRPRRHDEPSNRAGVTGRQLGAVPDRLLAPPG
jgi:hypothetical protein